MSTYLRDSEVSRLNAAPAGTPVPLSPETLTVLRAAREVCEQSGGAFDVTCRPLVELWRGAREAGRPPSRDERASARRASSWADLDLRDRAAVKRRGTAQVDLGGIAKGYAADRAAEALRAAGCAGGLVEVGGDIRCFGTDTRGRKWLIGVRDPFSADPRDTCGALAVADAGVCTSGHYARAVTIAGEAYSHILDPRDGEDVGMALRPRAAPASVTVVAPTAMTADAWATALSVLGEDGLRRLPPGGGIEAMLIFGPAGSPRVVKTPGFDKLLVGPIDLAPRGQEGN